MVQTFLFRTEATDKAYYQTVYSVDVQTAIVKWLQKLEDLQKEVYSFDITQVQDIKQQYSNGQLKVFVDREPYFLTFQAGDKNQVVYIDNVNKGQPDFLARVTYLTAEQGGRKEYAVSGYRPHVKFDGRKELTSGEQLFVDKDKAFPGETVITEIIISSVDIFKNYLFAGQHFEVAEASHLVGYGQVLEVINPALRKASR